MNGSLLDSNDPTAESLCLHPYNLIMNTFAPTTVRIHAERYASMHFSIDDSLCALDVHAVPCGRDLAVVVSGGCAPHVGCTVLALPHPALSGKGVGATVSCLNRPEHRDDAFASRIAKRIAKTLGCTVSCTCGIHIDAATLQDIEHIVALADVVVDEILARIPTETAKRQSSRQGITPPRARLNREENP